MKNEKKAEELLNKFRQKEETEREEAMLKYWLHHLNEDKTSGLSEDDLAEAHHGMWEVIKPESTSVRRYKFSWSIAAAALLFLTMFAGLYLYLDNRESTRINLATQKSNKIVPGGNKAILTLSDGKKILLSEASNLQLAEQSGIKISTTADGRIIYSVVNSTVKNTGKVLYNTIETPAGGQYQVNLPDGSLVWLNAATRLRFPTRFSGGERKVELDGEGYFEIAHNKKMPFKVKTALQEIEVLGTHFNINSYANEAETKTTLLEGSVRLTSLNSALPQVAILKPGQQSVFTSGNFKISQVDTEAAVAWKNGYFRFDDEELESIMYKVSRWYDVEVVYENEKLKKEPFAGIITRTTKLSELLKMLELTGEVKFEIENNKIIVKDKK